MYDTTLNALTALTTLSVYCPWPFPKPWDFPFPPILLA